MKNSIRCDIPQPFEAFGNYKRYADGKHRYCRTCWNEIATQWKREHGVKPMQPFLKRLWGSIQQCGHGWDCLYCCWPWLKARDDDGYGRFAVTYYKQKSNPPVTRIIYEIWNARQIPDGMFACHTCDFPPCCNPLHLWLGTLQDNRTDCMKKGRQAKGATSGYHTMPEAFPRGEQHHKAKLTEAKVIDVRNRYAQGNITAQRLADELGVSKHSILDILHHKSWKHI